LQQTQVAVVIPYFERWMIRFPTISILAAASLEEVIKEWEGLGYYSRARNLHEGAKYVVQHYKGELPANREDLSKIKGLGPYTVGAILSFAFHQRAAAVDGNVLRVLARFYGLEDDISKGPTVKKMQTMAEALLPEEQPWLIAEALIELGATVCCRVAKCFECPLNKGCEAYARGMADRLPVKSGQSKTIALYRAVAVVTHEDRFLVKLGTKGKVMADLCEFPYFEFTTDQIEKDAVVTRVEKELKLDVKWISELPSVKHTFTRYRAMLMPHRFIADKAITIDGYEWMSVETLKKKAFSSGHRRILAGITFRTK